MVSKLKQPFKRIIVLSDGTWQTLETEVATNVREIAKAIRYEDDAGVQQVVHYDPGLGTNGGMDSMTGGAMGVGIDKNIQQLYTFLALNYEPGDEIYMFGFSRGAYTVRSLVGLIYNAGLVRRDQIEFVKEAYDQYRGKVGADSDKAKEFRAKHGDRPAITLLACFDTVSALGLPTFLGKFTDEKYAFHDDTINANVVNAIHCLSIDETRAAYAPEMMKFNPEVGPGQLTQKWFYGDHSGVGGGGSNYEGASAVALAFMLEEIRNRNLGLSFYDKKLPTSVDTTSPRSLPKKSNGGFLDWIQRLAGVEPRKIDSVDDVHPEAIKRYQAVEAWRPGALQKMEEQLKTYICQ